MYESYRPHPLLAQVPLTVSPFINLPTTVTLPYTYNLLEREHAASPEEILAACNALEQHLNKTRRDAEKAIRDWEESIVQRELAEKRRVAPGWLDREEKLLRPMNTAAGSGSPEGGAAQSSLLDSLSAADPGAAALPSMVPRDEGEELDRAFGGLNVK